MTVRFSRTSHAETQRTFAKPSIVTVYGHEAGQSLADAIGIDHISFTGSARVGTNIAQSAAKRCIPVTLELGGKSPQIAFADANLDEAIPVIANAIIQNAGQTCSAGPRLLVEASVYERVLEAVGQRIKALKVGPAAMDLDVGPLIRANQLERVNGFLREAENANLRTIAPGSIAAEAPETGFYATPTLIAGVPADAKLAQGEVYEPVLSANMILSLFVD